MSDAVDAFLFPNGDWQQGPAKTETPFASWIDPKCSGFSCGAPFWHLAGSWAALVAGGLAAHAQAPELSLTRRRGRVGVNGAAARCHCSWPKFRGALDFARFTH